MHMSLRPAVGIFGGSRVHNLGVIVAHNRVRTRL